jgi:hypothetical protein
MHYPSGFRTIDDTGPSYRSERYSAYLAPRADVRFGSKADILRCGNDVRFTPESGHLQCNSPCLLRANSGHRRSANHSFYAEGPADEQIAVFRGSKPTQRSIARRPHPSSMLVQLPTLQLNITTVAHDHPPARFEIVVVIVPPKRNFVAASDRS